MTQDDMIEHVTAGVAKLPHIRGLFLAGSHGRGSADIHSDIDLLAIADEQHHAQVAVDWRNLVEAITHVVFWQERGRGPILLNAITYEWLRCDMFVIAPAAFATRARNTVRPLIDPENLFAALPPSLEQKSPDAARVTYLINEFIRVLGLLSVVVGRAEYFVAANGVGLLRDHLVNLMIEEVPLADRGGALHLSKSLPPQQIEILRTLPFPGPERDAVVAAHIAIARLFFPRARALALQLGIAWPSEFETATKRHLQQAFAGEGDISW